MPIDALTPSEETLGLANYSLRTTIGTKNGHHCRLLTSIPWDIGRQPSDHRNGYLSLSGLSIFELSQIKIIIHPEHAQIAQLLTPSNASTESEQDLQFLDRFTSMRPWVDQAWILSNIVHSSLKILPGQTGSQTLVSRALMHCSGDSKDNGEMTHYRQLSVVSSITNDTKERENFGAQHRGKM